MWEGTLKTYIVQLLGRKDEVEAVTVKERGGVLTPLADGEMAAR